MRGRIERVEICEAHFKRLRVKIRAKFRVNQTPFCVNCFHGRPIRSAEMDGELKRPYRRDPNRIRLRSYAPQLCRSYHDRPLKSAAAATQWAATRSAPIDGEKHRIEATAAQIA